MKTRFHWDIFSSRLLVGFWDDRSGRRAHARPVELIFEEKPEGVVIEPTLYFFDENGREFLKDAVEFASSSGIKPESDSKLLGRLEATSYHLEDLRKLLKLKDRA